MTTHDSSPILVYTQHRLWQRQTFSLMDHTIVNRWQFLTQAGEAPVNLSSLVATPVKVKFIRSRVWGEIFGVLVFGAITLFSVLVLLFPMNMLMGISFGIVTAFYLALVWSDWPPRRVMWQFTTSQMLAVISIIAKPYQLDEAELFVDALSKQISLCQTSKAAT